jgi:hypothetical protein
MKNSIFVCHNPVETYWQLGQTATVRGNFALIGWRISPTPIDGGMPGAVAEILARTMVSATQVIFPSSYATGNSASEWKSVGDDSICVLKEESLIKRALNSLSDIPSKITLLSTRQIEKVIGLFDDAAYPWWMQGQVALLSEPEKTTPKIDRQTFLSLFESDWMQQALELQSIGIQGVLRPGTDGDTAGFLFVRETFRNVFLTSLENESRVANFDYRLLLEADFTSALAKNG